MRNVWKAGAAGALIGGVLLHRKRREKVLLPLYQRTVVKDPPKWWEDTVVSYRHQIKATRTLLRIDHILRLAGFTRAEFRLVLPLLHHIESVVYRADLLYEAVQQEGRVHVPGSWTEEVTRLLEDHGAANEQVRTEMARLEEYFVQESRLLLSEETPREQDIIAVTALRSSDVRLLVRAAFALRGVPCDEHYLALLQPWLAINEIRDDLNSYEADVKEGSFNTLREFIRVHGRDEAGSRLREAQRQLALETVESMRHAPSRSIARFWAAWAAADVAIPVVAPWMFLALPRPVSRWVLRRLLQHPGKDWLFGKIPQEMYIEGCRLGVSAEAGVIPGKEAATGI